MLALYYITQLPDYRAQLTRQLDLLEVAEGFTPAQKADLIALYKQLLAKVDEIMADDITVTEPETL